MIRLYCPTCGEKLAEKTRYCPHCGRKRNKVLVLPLLTAISILIFSGTLYYFFSQQNKEVSTKTAIASVKAEKKEEKEVQHPVKLAAAPRNSLPKATQKELTEVIAEVQKGVYTVYTESGQGSAFLMNKNGDVVTNAHVVEGYHHVSVKDKNGVSHEGKVIGYSNAVDVALIRVPDLKGVTPLPLETAKKAVMGEEVIALGSPMGLENTAAFGYITGIDRSFFIGNRSYENNYQTSAPIAPGSSGGPLVAKSTGKVIAINSAKLIGQDAVGFSIPVMDVYELIQGWSKQPLTEEEIDQLFYNENGDYYYEDLWSDDEWYFDGGESSDEEINEYYDIPSEWYEEPKDGQYEANEEETPFHDEDMNDHSTPYDESIPYGESESYDDDIPYEENEPYDDSIPYDESESYDDSVPYDESESYDDGMLEGEINDAPEPEIEETEEINSY